MQLIFLIGLVWHHPSEDSGSLLHRHISVPSNGINDVCLSTEQQSGWMRSSNSHQSSIKISEVFAKGFPVNLLSTSSKVCLVFRNSSAFRITSEAESLG